MKSMSIRVKSVIFIILVNIISIGSLSYFTNNSLTTKLLQYEEKQIEQKLRIAKKAIESEIENIDTSVKDYAYWDDTYSFMLDKNGNYVESNINDETFGIIGVNYILYFNTHGELYYLKGYDTKKSQPLIPTESLSNVFNTVSKVLYSGNLNGSGILVVDDSYYIVVARPILKSNREGPSTGTLMMLAALDKEKLDAIKDRIQIAFHIESFDQVKSTLDKTTLASLMDRGYVIINNKTINGSIIIEGMDMKPVVVLSVDNEKILSSLAASTIKTINIVTLIIMVLSTIFGLIFMEVTVVKPIKYLVSEITKVRTRKIASQKIDIKASGEMQVLVSSINVMLETLNNFDKKLVEVNSELEKKAKEVQENTIEMERLNKHMVGRELRMAELKEEIEDLRFRLTQKGEDVSILE